MALLKKAIWVLATVVVALLTLILGYRWQAYRGPILPPENLTDHSVMDMHVHAAGLGDGESGCYLSPEIRYSYKISHYLAAYGLTREQLVKGGDKQSIEQIARWVGESKFVRGAVVLALDGAVTKGVLDLEHTEVLVPNEFVSREVKRFPHLRWGASIHPGRRDALARLNAAKKDGAVLVKWIPAIQGMDPADTAWTPYYQTLKRLGLPLLTHTGNEGSFTRADDKLGDPRKLKLPLSLGVTVIAAHAATLGTTDGIENMELLMPMLEEFPNLYADISSLTQLNKLGFLRRLLLDKRAKGKLIYGSDFPLTNTLIVSPYHHPLDLTWSTMRGLSAINNPFDRDVALKQALGVPAEVFLRQVVP